MLVRECTKKLTNVSIITYKKHGKKYELAVYPNKLFEYRHDRNTPLEEILHTRQIFRSLVTGDVASSAELEVFGKPHEEIIREILDQGYEQKAAATSKYELGAIERQIVDIVQEKVTYNGCYVSQEVLSGFIKSVWDIKNEAPKKQAQAVVRRLEEIGFERVSYLVRCNASGISFPGATPTHDGMLVKSDILPDFIAYCDSEGIPYVVVKKDEVEEEEIC